MIFKLTPSALEDFDAIGCYTVENWGAKQCEVYFDKLDASFHQLAENPYLGLCRNEIKQNYYSFPVGSHVIYYRIQQGFIEITAILHKSMDAQRHL